MLTSYITQGEMGRPKGSKDLTPRKRRTKAELAAAVLVQSASTRSVRRRVGSLGGAGSAAARRVQPRREREAVIADTNEEPNRDGPLWQVLSVLIVGGGEMGRRGDYRAKLKTIVRMIFEPTVTTPDDIATVFFEKPEYTFRYFKAGYNDAVDDVETVMGSAGPLEKLRPYLPSQLGGNPSGTGNVQLECPLPPSYTAEELASVVPSEDQQCGELFQLRVTCGQRVTCSRPV